MENCLFCKIIGKEIPATIVFEDDQVMAFEDICPQAPVHVLIIPKRHIATLNDLTQDEESLIGHMHIAAARIAREMKIAESGYRLVTNCNNDGGQTVFHIHSHLLGGRGLAWPPG